MGSEMCIRDRAQRDAAAARDDAKDARDAAARNERALTQRDESLARTSKDFEAAATSEIESVSLFLSPCGQIF